MIKKAFDFGGFVYYAQIEYPFVGHLLMIQDGDEEAYSLSSASATTLFLHGLASQRDFAQVFNSSHHVGHSSLNFLNDNLGLVCLHGGQRLHASAIGCQQKSRAKSWSAKKCICRSSTMTGSVLSKTLQFFRQICIVPSRPALYLASDSAARVAITSARRSSFF